MITDCELCELETRNGVLQNDQSHLHMQFMVLVSVQMTV